VLDVMGGFAGKNNTGDEKGTHRSAFKYTFGLLRL
jgi:hypothetical protein